MEVLGIGPQTPEQAKSMKLPFPLLSDVDLAVTTSYGLVHPKGYMGKDAPRPATLLVDKGGRTVRWMRTSSNYRTRPPVEEVFEALRQ